MLVCVQRASVHSFGRGSLICSEHIAGFLWAFDLDFVASSHGSALLICHASPSAVGWAVTANQMSLRRLWPSTKKPNSRSNPTVILASSWMGPASVKRGRCRSCPTSPVFPRQQAYFGRSQPRLWANKRHHRPLLAGILVSSMQIVFVDFDQCCQPTAA
jgi:hypothetical protein